MRNVKVLVTHFQARQDDLDHIRRVDPRVEVAYALDESRTTRDFVDSYRASGAGNPPHLDPGDFSREVAEAEVIFGLNLPKDILQRAPRLKWVQVLGAGMDYLHGTGLLEAGITITTSAGANAVAVAEFCVLMMLMHVKHLPQRLKAQGEHRWVRFLNEELRGKTLGIIGVGHIGAALAQRAKALEMRVLATRRSYVPGERVPQVDEVYPRERLRDMLAQCDYTVAAVSLTPETRGMLGAAEFLAMKGGAFFINVARGPVVDEAALLNALRAGHLSGAGLDVFNQEPLPPDSPLWDLPNVYVIPHNAGGLRGHSRIATQMFCENLRRYLNGQPLQNVVTPEKGY